MKAIFLLGLCLVSYCYANHTSDSVHLREEVNNRQLWQEMLREHFNAKRQGLEQALMASTKFQKFASRFAKKLETEGFLSLYDEAYDLYRDQDKGHYDVYKFVADVWLTSLPPAERAKITIPTEYWAAEEFRKTLGDFLTTSFRKPPYPAKELYSDIRSLALIAGPLTEQNRAADPIWKLVQKSVNERVNDLPSNWQGKFLYWRNMGASYMAAHPNDQRSVTGGGVYDENDRHLEWLTMRARGVYPLPDFTAYVKRGETGTTTASASTAAVTASPVRVVQPTQYDPHHTFESGIPQALVAAGRVYKVRAPNGAINNWYLSGFDGAGKPNWHFVGVYSAR